MKFSKKLSLATFLSTAAFMFLAVPQALAATKTWTGAVDGSFNTAGNWSPSGVPVSNDDLVFDSDSFTGEANAVNDLTGVTFDNITFQGTGGVWFELSGNSFTLTGGITNNADSPQSITAPITISGTQSIALTDYSLFLSSVLSGSGALNKTGDGILFLSGNSSSYSGNISISTGEVWVEHINALGDASGSTTISNNATIQFVLDGMANNSTIAEPITIAGDGNGLGFTNYALGLYDSDSASTKSLTLSGAITLTADTYVAPWRELKLTGALSGTYKIQVAQGNTGKLVLQSSPNTSQTANGTHEAPKVSSTLSDDNASTPVSINYNETIIITGKRGGISVNEGGTLKGTGTVDWVVVNKGATLAPGLSPGCINTGDLDFLAGSTYEFEIGGTVACSGYDQTRVTGAVDLGNGTLSTVLFNNYKPKAGEAYTIIDNDGSDAIVGTFLNLPNNATFTVSGYVFRINYVGGSGNDVVVTVVSVPVAPATGFNMVKNNPELTLLASTILAAGILYIRNRYGRLSER